MYIHALAFSNFLVGIPIILPRLESKFCREFRALYLFFVKRSPRNFKSAERSVCRNRIQGTISPPKPQQFLSKTLSTTIYNNKVYFLAVFSIITNLRAEKEASQW